MCRGDFYSPWHKRLWGAESSCSWLLWCLVRTTITKCVAVRVYVGNTSLSPDPQNVLPTCFCCNISRRMQTICFDSVVGVCAIYLRSLVTNTYKDFTKTFFHVHKMRCACPCTGCDIFTRILLWIHKTLNEVACSLEVKLLTQCTHTDQCLLVALTCWLPGWMNGLFWA